MSMISEQIQEIRECARECRQKDDGTAKILRDAADTIEELSTKLTAANMERSSAYYNGGWIPCDVLLPQEKENPITMDYYEYQVTFECDGVRDVRYYKFGEGHWWNGPGIMDRYVTAWRERPKPYKKEART